MTAWALVHESAVLKARLWANERASQSVPTWAWSSVAAKAETSEHLQARMTATKMGAEWAAGLVVTWAVAEARASAAASAGTTGAAKESVWARK